MKICILCQGALTVITYFRGSLHSFNQFLPTGPSFTQCTACSPTVTQLYKVSAMSSFTQCTACSPTVTQLYKVSVMSSFTQSVPGQYYVLHSPSVQLVVPLSPSCTRSLLCPSFTQYSACSPTVIKLCLVSTWSLLHSSYSLCLWFHCYQAVECQYFLHLYSP